VIAIAPFEQPFFYMQLNSAILRVWFAYDGVEPHDSKKPKCIGEIQKPNGSGIKLGYFLNEEMEEISAVLFSNTATFAKLQALSSDSKHRVFFRSLRLDGNTRKLVQTVKGKSEYKEALLDGLSV